jgi:hypothetical protein
MLSSYAVPDLGRLALTIAARRLDPDREKLVLERRSRTRLSAVPTTRNSGKSDEVGRERLWSMAALRLPLREAAQREALDPFSSHPPCALENKRAW